MTEECNVSQTTNTENDDLPSPLATDNPENVSGASAVQPSVFIIPPRSALDTHESNEDSSNGAENQQLQSHSPVRSVESFTCRICLLSAEKERLIAPCNCKGSLAFVHRSCLERWLNRHGQNYCELCLYRYNVVETPRYTALQSLRLWLCHPRVRRYIQADVLLLALLTFIAFALVAICLLGLHYLFEEWSKWGISSTVLSVLTGLLVTALIVGYLATVFLVLRDQLTPWYYWWRRSVRIQLILETPEASIPNNIV